MTRPSLLIRAAQAMLVPLVVAGVTALIVADIVLGAGPGTREVTVPPVYAPSQPPAQSEPVSPERGCMLMPNSIMVCEPDAMGLTRTSEVRPHVLESGTHAAREKPCVAETFPPRPEAVAMVELIVASVGLVPNFAVLEGAFNDTCIAVAGMINGKRAVVYDRERFHWQGGRAQWSDVGIMAHEVGHILSSHWMDGGSRPPTELEADYFSGFVLARMGSTLSQALAWTPLVSETGGDSHPPRNSRIRAVARGWGEAMNQAAPATRSNAWLGEAFEMAGATCRLAQVAKGGGSIVRITCERAGQWVWAD